MPEEAQEHADVIFVGEAESLWEQFLKDLESGTHVRRYRAAIPPALDAAPMARKELYHPRNGSLRFGVMWRIAHFVGHDARFETAFASPVG